jgi:hypothetical protein
MDISICNSISFSLCTCLSVKTPKLLLKRGLSRKNSDHNMDPWLNLLYKECNKSTYIKPTLPTLNWKGHEFNNGDRHCVCQ